MKKVAVVFLFGFVALTSVKAQQTSPTPQSTAPQPQSSATTRPLGVINAIKKTVGLMRVAYVGEDGVHEVEGTCFFVFYEDKRGGDNFGFMYLVTNRHMAKPGIQDAMNYPILWTHLRLNLQHSEQGSEESTLPIAGPLHWYFPEDDSVDLAVLPILPDQTKYDYLPIPISIFATRDVVDAQQVTEGDGVLFTGYFYQFPGLKKFQPIVREGILAMLPDEKLDTTLRKPGHLYLADVHVFGGNSGSPLFVNLGGMRSTGSFSGIKYNFLGVVSGFYHEDSDFKLSISTTLTGRVAQNSGIAMIVPADELKSLLDSSPLQAVRDAELAAKKPK